VALQDGQLDDAVFYLGKAHELDTLDTDLSPTIAGNYVEALRSVGREAEASAIGHKCLAKIKRMSVRDGARIRYNVAIVDEKLGRDVEAIALFKQVLVHLVI
jgi:hypothetical protein